LLLHAGLLGPSTPPAEVPARPGTPALHWRLLPPAVEGEAVAARAPQVEAKARRAAAAPVPKRIADTPRSNDAAPALGWPPSGQWRYRLISHGENGEAEISWQQDGERYQLELRRRTSARVLPSWRSEGRLLANGLQPLRFSTQRGERSQTRLQFEPEAARLAGAQGRWQPAPALTQDRLSWMWQLAALAASRPLRPGQRLRLDVASWQGELQHWDMEVERDPDAPQLLRLRRLPPEGSLLSQLIWLDPARGHLPVRLQLRYDDAERWEIELLPTP
jgi:hypothetical protein